MILIRILVLLFFASIAGASELSFEATDGEGATKTGVLTKLDARRVVLQVGELEEMIPLERLSLLKNRGENPFRVRETASEPSPKKRNPSTDLDPKPEDKPAERPEAGTKRIWPATVFVLELSDGSKLIAGELTVKNGAVDGKYLDENKFSVTLKQVASIRFGVGDVMEIATVPADWQRLAVPSDKGDRIVVGKPGSLDVYEGILSGITTETVSFIIDGETLPVPRRKVYGFIPHPDPEATKATIDSLGTLHLYDGGHIQLGSLELGDERVLHWTARCGVSGSVKLEDVERIDFGRGNAVFLSELHPVRVEHAFIFERKEGADKNSAFSLLRSFRSQRILSETQTTENPDDMDPLLQSLRQRQSGRGGRENKLPERPIPGPVGVQLDGVSYENSLSIPARSVLEYPLAGSFAVFRGVAGIDDRLRPNAAARFAVYTGEQLLGEILLRGDEPARKFAFNLPDGAVSLRLVVDFPEPAIGPATLALGDPKLSK